MLQAQAVHPVAFVPSCAPPIQQFDGHAYLDGMRALGSTFYVTRDLATGREGLCEEYPDEGWSDAEHVQILDLCRQYRACPGIKRQVKNILIDEGRLHLWTSNAEVVR